MITETQIRIMRARLHAARGEAEIAERLLADFACDQCPECGRSFRRLVGNKRYCTDKCRSRAANRRHRQRSRNGRGEWHNYQRAYYQAHRERLRAASRARYEADREARLACARRRYREDEAFRERCKQRSRAQQTNLS